MNGNFGGSESGRKDFLCPFQPVDIARLPFSAATPAPSQVYLPAYFFTNSRKARGEYAVR